MATYKELQDQIAALQYQAEETRAQELHGAIQEIMALMDEYGISLQDLSTAARTKGKKSNQQVNIQFRDADRNTWSGRGRMPGWLKGKERERFRTA